MSRMRSLMGAVGAAGAGIAAKYVDDEIATNRSKMLADLQVQTAGRIREQDDAFANDPTRVARDRQRKREDVLASGATADEMELARLQNPALRGAKRTAADEDAAAETARREASLRQLMGPEAERESLMAEARARAGARYRDPREKKVTLAEAIAEKEKVLGRALTEPEKLALMGLVKSQRDPELDTETETVKIIDKDGNERTVTRKKIRKPGADGGGGGMTEQQAHEQARAAIAAGASPVAVNKRLTDAGFGALAAATPSKGGATATTAPDAARTPEEVGAAAEEAARNKSRNEGYSLYSMARSASDDITREFSSDVASMTPLELLQKYDLPSQRGRLTSKQLTQLKEIERRVR